MNNSKTIKIQLNGNPYDIGSGMSLNQFLETLRISNTKVAIEINGIIAEQNNYDNIILKKDDKLEIVHFIGGG